MSARDGAAGVAAVALLLSAGCREAVPPERPRLEARSCRLRLGGPLAGDLPCHGLAWEREDGWMISAVLPAGGRIAGSVQLLVAADGAALPPSPLPAGRALFRQPGRAGVGVVWGGVPHGTVRLALAGGRPVSARVEAVVSPLRANPVDEPLRLELALELAAPELVTGPP